MSRYSIILKTQVRQLKLKTIYGADMITVQQAQFRFRRFLSGIFDVWAEEEKSYAPKLHLRKIDDPFLKRMVTGDKNCNTYSNEKGNGLGWRTVSRQKWSLNQDWRPARFCCAFSVISEIFTSMSCSLNTNFRSLLSALQPSVKIFYSNFLPLWTRVSIREA